MEEQPLSAQPRPDIGSRPSRRLRGQGRVPATLYGRSQDPLSLSVDARDLRNALSTEAGFNVLLSIGLDGTDHLALTREVQRHPVKGTFDHVDFVTVERDREVSAEVPIRLTGEAVEVQRADGLVDQMLYRLTVSARPGDIPTSIEVDVSELTVGDTYRVGQLVLPAGVTTDVDPEEPVVSGAASQLVVAAEGEEGAAEDEGPEASEASPESSDEG